MIMVFRRLARTDDADMKEVRRGIAGLYLELRDPATPEIRKAEIMGALTRLESRLSRAPGGRT